jgi:hypothetical protein
MDTAITLRYITGTTSGAGTTYPSRNTPEYAYHIFINNYTNINKKKNHFNLLNTKKTMTYNVYLSNIYKYISSQVNKVLDMIFVGAKLLNILN